MKKVLFGTLVLFATFGFAQKDSNSKTNNEAYDGNSVKEKHRGKGDMAGSPYMNDNFLPAIVDGVDNIPARYNAHKNEFEYQKDGQIYLLVGIPGKTVVEYKSPKKKYVYVDYKEDKKFLTGYLVEMNSGKFKLYKRELKKFIPGIAPKTSYDRQTPDEYKLQKDEFFMRINDGEIINITTNKKNFAKQFGDKEKEISQYIKDKDISLNDENKLKLLAQYLNQIL